LSIYILVVVHCVVLYIMVDLSVYILVIIPCCARSFRYCTEGYIVWTKSQVQYICCSPWPEEGLEFTTLWCRAVCASCKEWKFQLRDFPQPLLDIRDLHIWGRLVGAEQEATRRGMVQGTQTIKLAADFICYW